MKEWSRLVERRLSRIMKMYMHHLNLGKINTSREGSDKKVTLEDLKQ